MTQPARTKTWQRVIDCIIGMIIVLIGVGSFARFLQHPIQHETYGLVWAVLLACSGAAIIVGAMMRTVQPGRKQSVGFQFELGGWGASAFLIFAYAAVNYTKDHDMILLLALVLIVVTLFGSWLRLVAAMRDVITGRFR